jgi:hypothetical protein
LIDDKTIYELAEFTNDPLGFVLWAFPWGEPNSELEFAQIEPWQEKILNEIGLRLRAGATRLDAVTGAIRMARTSGHGIGKSALVSWLILWAMSTFDDTVGVVTANTETQLKTKTWVQLAKWFRICVTRSMFKMTATALFSTDPEHERTWRMDMVPWSERNTEAFAGLHNQGKRILLVFDEASAIPDTIWEVAEGALTDQNTQIIWAVFGNPTRNKGRFRDCFPGGKFAHRWSSDVIDSREVSFTDKTQIAEWIQDHGEDSDFVRIRVRGIFPRVDSESWIPYDLARGAINREIPPQRGAIVVGVDVGRFGDDPSVIYPRKGRDAVTWKPEIMYGLDTMAVAARSAATYLRLHASVVMVDGGGVGGGVVDRLRQLRIPVMEVDFGASSDNANPDDGTRYANKRAEIWGAMKNWLRGGAIPEIVVGEHAGGKITLADELTGPNYGLNGREQVQLEGKKDMRKRGIPSPNVADALACTFAYPAMEADIATPQEMEMEQPTVAPDYNPYSDSIMHTLH